MIPRLTMNEAVPAEIKKFLDDLKGQADFHGEIDEAFSTRLTLATDNSVYQVAPQAVVFPKSQQDIETIFKLASQKQYQEIAFAPRGGGTGTNGQSLCAGIIIDCSRHMNHILEVNIDEGWVKVEPGVVLDQLNDYLKPYGKFFAPTLSPSSRATLGGMINTDACGKGSRLYGKTSQHVLELTAVYADGECHTSKAIPVQDLKKMQALPGRVGKLYQQLFETVKNHKHEIKTQLPKLHRFLTGYNLERIYSDDEKQFNLNYVLTGAEGTLAYITRAKLKLTDIPKCKALFVVLYPSFSEALDHAKQLVKYNPAAIETMDEMVLSLAKTDIFYQNVAEFLKLQKLKSFAAINLIEFVAQDEKSLQAQIQPFADSLNEFDHHFVNQPKDIENLWALRKRSVGLLGKVKGDRKPISGVEDTVVPPEHLPEYIAEFRKILDAQGLKYGMFGHIDVGCLHVRPAFDLLNENDLQKYYEVIDQVAKLTQKYGGVLWGEHGKGFRSEYVPLFFGETLYQELRKIKGSCDPHNQLNPGKIAVPIGHDTPLAQIRSEHTRAKADKFIDEKFRKEYELPLSCNGNGSCFNYSQNDVMCPSYKITRDRRHSPKGRATLVREWLRQLSVVDEDSKKSNIITKVKNAWEKKQGQYDFSHEVFEAMEGCLACQACKSQCPVNINVPSFKAKFLEAYHTRYPRSLANLLIAYSERMGYYQSYFPKTNNFFLKNSLIKWFLAKAFGFVEPPLFSTPNLYTRLKQEEIPLLDLKSLPKDENAAVFIQDWVTSFYEAELVIKICLLIRKLGFKIYVLPWFENGKTFHVNGMLKTFKKLAEKNVAMFQKIAEKNIPMIGLDPTMVLTYQFEYPEVVANANGYQVLLLQEWLMENMRNLKLAKNSKENYILLSHCTEQANCSEAEKQWQKVFETFGLTLSPEKIGCCGMAGAYGHEAKHQSESKGLFDLAWREHFEDSEKSKNVLVDGFSCRAQVERFMDDKPKHPAEILLGVLNSGFPPSRE